MTFNDTVGAGLVVRDVFEHACGLVIVVRCDVIN